MKRSPSHDLGVALKETHQQHKEVSAAPAGQISPLTARRSRAPNAAPQGSRLPLAKAAQSLSDVMYQDLRTLIMSLALRPGAPISENAIAAQKGVSRTPVREAIMRLAKESLVEVVPKSGTFVGRIAISALPQALIARMALERVVIQTAAKLATPARVAPLYVNIEQQFLAAEQGDTAAFHQLDEDFHGLIVDIGQLPQIGKFIETIKAPLDRFRRLTLTEAGRMHNGANEHARIADAIRDNDPDRASDEICFHLTKLQKYFSTGIAAHPTCFIHDLDLTDMAFIHCT